VRAHAELHLERSGGRDRLTRLRSQAPLVLRMHGRTLHLVGGAAGPLAGDETRLCIRVGAGAHLRVRSVAATVALPGAGTAPSTSQISVRVGAGAVLDWAPEPLVLAAGSHHRAAVAVTLEPSAVLRWREVVVLGRHQEPPGLLETTTRIVRGGIPVLDQEHAWGTGAPSGWDGPAGIGAARVVVTVLEVGVVTDRARSDPKAATLAISEDVRLHVALGTTVDEASALLADVEPLPDALGQTAS
jgi:urease accessory protein